MDNTQWIVVFRAKTNRKPGKSLNTKEKPRIHKEIEKKTTEKEKQNENKHKNKKNQQTNTKYNK